VVPPSKSLTQSWALAISQNVQKCVLGAEISQLLHATFSPIASLEYNRKKEAKKKDRC